MTRRFVLNSTVRAPAALIIAAATALSLPVNFAGAQQPPVPAGGQFIEIRPLPDADRPGMEPARPSAPILRGPSGPLPGPRGGGAPAAGPSSSASSGSSSVQMRTIGSAAGRVSYRRGFVRGVGVNVIEVNMRDPQVKIGVMLAEGGIGRVESFERMMARARPTAAITGTFFGLNNMEPTGDIVIDGQPAWRGFIGTAVAITANNRVAFVPTRYKDTRVDWRAYETVIRGGPGLLRGREFTVAPYEEGFFSLGEFARHYRTAIGVTADSRMLLVAVRQTITMWELAKVMYSLGAWDAIALDGGTSTAMYYGGNVIARPGRSMTNVLCIYADRKHYEAMRPQLGGARRSGSGGAAPATVPAGLAMPPAGREGTGFEPAQPDPARPPNGHYRLDIRIEPMPPMPGRR